jgi:hypothetical protein
MSTNKTANNDDDGWWRELPAALGAAVLASGVVVYGLLAAAYDKFYSELGLTPADVGVQYGKTLGGTAALTILVVLSMAAATGVFWLLLQRFKSAGKPTPKWIALGVALSAVGLAIELTSRFSEGTAAAAVLLAGIPLLFIPAALLAGSLVSTERAKMAVSVAAGAGVTWLLLSSLLYALANWRADDVKEGHWVEPPETVGLVFFSVRAMPTKLETASDADADEELVGELNDDKLLFLGAADGLLVIYNATTQQALLLPATQFRAPVINCETQKQDDPICDEMS